MKTLWRMKKNWKDAGKTGIKLAPDIYVLQWWTPILWDDAADPDFVKSDGIEMIGWRYEDGEELLK